MKFVCYDIKWDTDGSVKDEKQLPTRMEIEIDKEDIEKYNLLKDEDSLVDFLSDAITEETGYCHKGFLYHKKEPIVNEPGVCPYCGSENVSYGSFEIEGEECYYELTCDDCDELSYEWYSLKHIETRGTR